MPEFLAVAPARIPTLARVTGKSEASADGRLDGLDGEGAAVGSFETQLERRRAGLRAGIDASSFKEKKFDDGLAKAVVLPLVVKTAPSFSFPMKDCAVATPTR